MAKEKASSSATFEAMDWKPLEGGSARCLLKKHLYRNFGTVTEGGDEPGDLVEFSSPMCHSIWMKIERVKADWLMEKME